MFQTLVICLCGLLYLAGLVVALIAIAKTT
jgi:hypothetical protein